VDCSDTIADTIIRKEQAAELENPSGCFARESEVLSFDNDGHLVSRRLADLHVGDRVASVDASGQVSTTHVIFVHDHLHEGATRILHFMDGYGHPSYYELTGAHLVPTALDCRGNFFAIGNIAWHLHSSSTRFCF